MSLWRKKVWTCFVFQYRFKKIDLFVTSFKRHWWHSRSDVTQFEWKKITVGVRILNYSLDHQNLMSEQVWALSTTAFRTTRNQWARLEKEKREGGKRGILENVYSTVASCRRHREGDKNLSYVTKLQCIKCIPCVPFTIVGNTHKSLVIYWRSTWLQRCLTQTWSMTWPL